MSQAKLKVKLLEHTPNPEKIVSMAGKLCYSPVGIDELEQNLTEENINKFVTMLINMGHESPVEHVSFTYAIEGVSRITEIQLVRHRIASYSIQSGRYVKRNNPYFITPPNIEKSKLASKRYEKIINESINAYNDIFLILMLNQMGFSDHVIEEMSIDEKFNLVTDLHEKNKELYSKYEKTAIEDARYAHLQSIGTKIIVTMNLRELLHFFQKRCCNRSQWEIRGLADEMLKLAKEVAPILFKKAGAPCTYGNCPEGKMSCSNPRR